MIYINALVGAMFLSLETGIVAEGLTWLILDIFHASRNVILGGELLMLIPLAVLFVVFYKTALSAEKAMAKGEL